MLASSAGGGAAIVIVYLVVAWVIPIIYSNRLGNRRNRRHCWLWGFFLGWIGVIIIALFNKKPTEEDLEVAELEHQVKLKNLRKQLDD